MRLRHFLLLLLLCIVGWIVIDLWQAPSGDLQSFDPKEVARLETEMWKSYYERRPVDLFLQLAQLVRYQYHLPLLRSYLTAYHASRAAFAFKDGQSRADYEKALPELEDFYIAIIRDRSKVGEIARRELDWWIIHRERGSQPPGALEGSLARLQAAIYGIPENRFESHARLRAEAMLLRDDTAARGGASAEDWRHIEELLQQSWAVHWHAIRGAIVQRM